MMRRLLLIALLIGAPSPSRAQTKPAPPTPAAAQPAKAGLDVPYTQFNLPNGLHVILHEDHRVPLVTVNVWYHVGSARETPGRTGFAHLFEHLMFMGSAHAKYGDFDQLLETAGATNNPPPPPHPPNYHHSPPPTPLHPPPLPQSH